MMVFFIILSSATLKDTLAAKNSQGVVSDGLVSNSCYCHLIALQLLKLFYLLRAVTKFLYLSFISVC